MRTLSITILTLLISGLVYAGNPKYEKAMKNALNQLKLCQTIDDYNTSANTFKMIANAEKSEWLPLYYHAFCQIIMSFMENEDKVKKDAYLDIAESSINQLLKNNHDESEVYALQAFMFTARLVVDPPARGQKYMMLSGESVGKALTLNPTNPRALYVQLSNETGMARFFGKDTAPYCDRINQLLDNWKGYNSAEKFYPQWGKREVTGLAKGCK